MHLQDKGARYESAQWTAKQTNSGFSVSFFWPVDKVAVTKPRKPRRRRRRPTKVNRRAKSPASVTLNELHPVNADKRQPTGTSASIDAHHPGNTHHSLTAPEESKLERASNLQEPPDQEEFSDQENSSDELDLVARKPVVYEMCQSIPGVQYVKESSRIKVAKLLYSTQPCQLEACGYIYIYIMRAIALCYSYAINEYRYKTQKARNKGNSMHK